LYVDTQDEQFRKHPNITFSLVGLHEISGRKELGKYLINKRNRETERQRDRETERQRDRETERQRDRETERQRDTEAATFMSPKGGRRTQV
jgi:hypothetical protein